MSRCRAEFVIEPFVEDSPGPHVKAGIEAIEAAGLTVVMGPFGSSVSGATDQVSEGLREMVSAAMKGGAARVLVEVVVDD